MKYLIIDGMLNGTGIRDQYEGGYLDPSLLGISKSLQLRLNDWLQKYEVQIYSGYNDKSRVEDLDKEGLDLAKAISEELGDVKVGYYSDGFSTKHQIT